MVIAALPQPLITQAINGTGDDKPRIRQILLHAGQTTLQAQAGYIPPICTAPVPEKCPPDEAPYCSEKTLAYLWLIQHRKLNHRFKTEFAALFQQSHCRFPEEALPDIVSGHLRLLLAPHYSHRATWLKQHMEAAGIILPPLRKQQDWQGRYLHQRENYFRAMRERDPAAARELLKSVWHNEKNHARRMLIRCLLINLSVEDEPFIRSILTDHKLWNKLLMNRIARGLYDTPGTQLHALFQEKMPSVLHYSPVYNSIQLAHPIKTLRRIRLEGAYQEWRFSLLDALDIMPPRFWMQHWHIDEETLLDALMKAPPLRRFTRMWYHSALRTHHLAFAEAACFRTGNRLNYNDIKKFLALASPETCQYLTLYWLAHSQKPLFSSPARFFLQSPHVDLYDEHLLEIVLETLAEVSTDRYMIRLKLLLNNLVYRIPLKSSDAFLQAAQQGQSANINKKTRLNLEDLRTFIRLRQQMHAAFNNTNSDI